MPPSPAGPRAQPVLIVSHAAELGGAEHFLLELATHLGAWRCRIVLFQDGPLRRALEQRGLAVTILPARQAVLGVRRGTGAARLFGAVPELIGLARELARQARGCRLIYANSQKAAAVAMLAGAIGRRPVMWHLHDILDAQHFAWPQRWILALSSRVLTSGVITVSAAATRAFLASGGSRRRVHTVLNGVDPDPFVPIHGVPRSVLRAELQLPDGPLVGMFGRIAAWKGQAILVEALPLLPDVRALIVGGPLFGEEAEAVALRALADRLGVADRVYFLGNRYDVPKLMRAVDLVVHCSIAPEPFGRVIVEALFAGTPVIATDGGASREILGDTDWLVPPGDPEALARRVRQALRDHTNGTLDVLRTRALAQLTLSRALAEIETLLS